MSRRTKRVAAAMAVAGGWNTGNIGAVASDLASAYDVSLATVGLFTTALFVTHALVQWPGGRAVDRLGPKGSAIASLLFIIGGNCIAMLAPVSSVALFGRLVTGVGSGMIFLAGSALIRRASGSSLAQGVFGGLGLAAGGFALAIVPQLATVVGWRAPFASATAIGAVALALVVSGVSADAREPQIDKIRLRTSTPLRRLCALYAGSYGLAVVLASWMPEFLRSELAISATAAGAIASLSLCVAVLSRPAGGWLLRHRPQLVRPAVAGSLLTGFFGSLLVLNSTGSGGALLATALIGVGAGLSFSPVVLDAEAVFPRAPASAFGVVNGVANTAVLVGTPLIGLAFTVEGGATTVFGALALLWLVPLIALPSRSELGVRLNLLKENPTLV